MLEMGTMTTTQIPSGGMGTWKLPSVQDLLVSVRSKQTPSPKPQVFGSSSPIIVNRDMPSCKKCRDDWVSHARSPCWHSLPRPEQTRRGLELGLDHKVVEKEELAFPQGGYDSMKDAKSLGIQANMSQNTKFPISHSRIITPFQSGRRPHSQAYNINGSNGNIVVSSSSRTAGKIASNDRHKLSEKHRRDGMGAYVQAADILRQDLNPGVLSGCPVCIHDYENGLEQNAFFIHLDNSPLVGGPIKKTKNDMLSEGLMWEFSIVLHQWPSHVCKKIEGIRIFAAQMAREREDGLRSDFSKTNKWQTDVRARILEQVLNTMERACTRHGLDIWTAQPSSSVSTMHSPITETSPTIGQKRSRETSEESEQNRRVKQKDYDTDP